MLRDCCANAASNVPTPLAPIETCSTKNAAALSARFEAHSEAFKERAADLGQKRSLVIDDNLTPRCETVGKRDTELSCQVIIAGPGPSHGLVTAGFPPMSRRSIASERHDLLEDLRDTG